MPDEMPRVTLSEWDRAKDHQPLVRIGIVLPDDRRSEVRLEVPSAGYLATPSPGLEHGRQLPAGGALVQCEEGGVRLQAGSADLGRAGEWRIGPARSEAPDAGETARVRGVVAGRGFHWEKHIDEEVPGTLIASRVNGHILLINELPIEEYLKGVITAEMSGDCPMALLKSQCVTARTWMLARTERKHDAAGFDYCNDDCCQRYQGFTHLTPSAARAVEETRGEIMLHRSGVIVDANYSKCCGGVVEGPESVWGFDKPGQYAVADAPPESYARTFVPVTASRLNEYFTGRWLETCDVFCSPQVVPPGDLARYLGAVDEDSEYFRWTVEYSREELERILLKKHFARIAQPVAPPLDRLEDLVVIRRGQSGRAIALNVVYRDRQGRQHTARISDQYWIRNALHEKFLYSSAFKVDCERNGEQAITLIRLTGAGWGHGAGLCQIGALGMALQEYDYRAILHHYFERMTIERVYR